MATYTVDLQASYTIYADSPEQVLEFVEDWGVVPELTSEHMPNSIESVSIIVKDFETDQVLLEDELTLKDYE
jgi:hypothetical protein